MALEFVLVHENENVLKINEIIPTENIEWRVSHSPKSCGPLASSKRDEATASGERWANAEHPLQFISFMNCGIKYLRNHAKVLP